MNDMRDEEVFTQLLREWEPIESQAASEPLRVWLPVLQDMLKEERELRAEGKWVRGPADLFGILDIARAEIRHTRFLAWLMDPAARHGLGTRFLELVLHRTFPGDQFEHLGDANPICEVARAMCRADILVSGPHFAIIIEAKIDAIESPDQCNYLYEQFSTEVGSRFIFLSPKGHAPQTADGDAREAFRSLSFTAVRDVLREALRGAGPAAGRAAAENYLLTLEREFPWPT